MTTNTWIVLLLALGVLIVLLSDQSGQLEVTHHVVGAGSGPVLRLGQVSDLHVTGRPFLADLVLAKLNEAQPELVVLTGDMLSRKANLPDLERFLDGLPPAAVKVAVLGNWEYWSETARELRPLYARHGVTLLVNDAQVFTLAGRALLIVGLDDKLAGQPDWPLASLRLREWQGPVLVLAHHPDLVNQLPRQPAGGQPPLMLAGHHHGGQIVLFGIPLESRARATPYLKGWTRDSRAQLYVSRGIGTTILPLRIGARPEVAVFDWRW